MNITYHSISIQGRKEKVKWMDECCRYSMIT